MEHAELLTVTVSPFATIAIGIIRIVPAGVAVEVRVELSSRMAAQKGQVHVIGDFDRTGVLRGDVRTAHERRTSGIELVEVYALPAHGLLKCLRLPSAVAFDGGVGVPTTHPHRTVMVYAACAEGLPDLRSALELDGTDVAQRHAGFGHTEEAGYSLAEVV